MFPDPSVRVPVENELSQYGPEEHERESSGAVGDSQGRRHMRRKIKEWTGIAKRDYRDLLARAEHPNQLTTPTWRLPF